MFRQDVLMGRRTSARGGSVVVTAGNRVTLTGPRADRFGLTVFVSQAAALAGETRGVVLSPDGGVDLPLIPISLATNGGNAHVSTHGVAMLGQIDYSNTGSNDVTVFWQETWFTQALDDI